MSAHPKVCTTVELTLFDRYTAPWIKVWEDESANIKQGRWCQGLPFLWSEDEFYGFLREFLGKVYDRVLSNNPGATHILDKHPRYSLYVEDINRLLPNARFIHMIRDGRDVAVSMVAAREKMGFGTGTIPDSAEAWSKYVRAAQEAGKYDGRYLEVRYEELYSDGVNVVEDVFDFCGLKASREEVTAIVDEYQFEKNKARKITAARNVEALDGHYRKGKVGSWLEELPTEQRQVFNEIAGDLLGELGYTRDPSWIKQREVGKECVEVY